MQHHGCYRWKVGTQKAQEHREEQEKQDEAVMQKKQEIIKTLCYVPGKRTFHAFLWRDYGLNVSLKRCARLMKKMNLKANPHIRDDYKNQATHSHEAAAAESRQFRIGPRRVVLTDITYFYCGPLRMPFLLNSEL